MSTRTWERRPSTTSGTTSRAARQGRNPTPDGFFDPRGKVILYGYSAGGVNALYAARGIDSWWYRYGSDGRRGTLEHTGRTPVRPPRPGARVEVDLLITVDPCPWLAAGEGWDRRVPPCVRWAQDWYQPVPTGGSRGSISGTSRGGSRVPSTHPGSNTWTWPASRASGSST